MKRCAMIAALGLAFALAACAAQGNRFEPADVPPKNAVIYVYRPYSYFGSAIDPVVTCGNESSAIRPGAYHAFIVPPGHLTCNVGAETTDVVDIDAEPRSYYVRERISLGVLLGHPQLNPMDTDEAQTEIQTCCVQQP